MALVSVERVTEVGDMTMDRERKAVTKGKRRESGVSATVNSAFSPCQ